MLSKGPLVRTSLLSKLTTELMKSKGADYQKPFAAVFLVKTVPKLTIYPSLHQVHTQNMINF